jgi:putative tryptophan/tyrosine transport system substrate-binding protein
MRRRALFSVMAGAAAWPILGRAEQKERIRRVGVVLLFSANDPETKARVRVFERGLQNLGWVQGANIQIEYRFAAGDIKRLRADADELIALPVDVIVTNVTAAVRHTRTIPIVVAMVHSLSVTDPELIESLSHPGRNVTGFTTFEPIIVGKWLELLKAIAPDIKQVGLMFNPDASQAYCETWLRQLEVFASPLAIGPSALRVLDLAELQGALAYLARRSDSGLLVVPDTFTVANYPSIVAQAQQNALPACYPYRYFATQGGLMSYGPNVPQAYRQIASYVDAILRGANPGDLPIQQPNTFELVINLKAANAMRVVVPPHLLARADEVIE